VLGLPPTLAAAVGRLQPIHTLTHPLVALPLWLATYFIWHIPVVYDTALHHTSSILHAEHVCYFAAGVLLWWPVLQAEPWRLQASAAAAYLFGAFVLASPLGLLLALLPDPIYSFYEHAPRLWGLSALSDQEIAGLTMAAEQAIVFFGAFTVFFMRFLRAEEGVVFVDR
jgi:putative membrane protein